MYGVIPVFADFIDFSVPLVGLFVLFIIGYKVAMKDFQPKHTAAENVNPGGNKRMITEGEAETHISPEPEITQPDFTVSSSAEAQKRVQLENRYESYQLILLRKRHKSLKDG